MEAHHTMDSLKKAMPVRVQITAILRKALFSGEYKSGDELSLTETAERLGVSRCGKHSRLWRPRASSSCG